LQLLRFLADCLAVWAMRTFVDVSLCNVRVPWLKGPQQIEKNLAHVFTWTQHTLCYANTMCVGSIYEYVCQTVRWGLPTTPPSKFLVHISVWLNYCQEGDASWLAGRYRAW